MSIGDWVEKNITDPVSDGLSSTEDFVEDYGSDFIVPGSGKLGEKAKDEWKEFTGEADAKRRAERMERRQQKQKEKMRQQREKQKQRRKMTIMQVLQDQGAPSLFDMLGSAQESL